MIAESTILSDITDSNHCPFVLASDGQLSFGEISPESGLLPAPIMLSAGLITNTSTNDGEQIRKAGYTSVVDFVEKVAKNYESIREGKKRRGRQTYLLQLTDKRHNTLIVELSQDYTYWNINTAGIFKSSYGAKNKVVYNRPTSAKQSAETTEATRLDEQCSTRSNPSRSNTPTQQCK